VAGPPALDMASAARLPVADVLGGLGTSEAGLGTDEADQRLAAVGPNVLASHRVTAFGVLVRQLRNPLLILLLAAAGVSAITGDIADGAIIAVIVVLSVGLGFVNEYRSEVAVAALHANIRHTALVWRDGTQLGTLLVTKGAPEAVLGHCVDLPSEANATLQRLFADGARVVAVATREVPGLTDPGLDDERDLHLAGFLTFVDRPKPDAGTSIAKLNRLGVAVKIITGDNGVVAEKVCRDIGVDVEAVLTGVEVERLDDDALAAAIPGTTVFARVSPDQKSRIIKVARRTGVDVGFMGDGVNDAVALHAADVGISVESATDVAKDAADVVLLDKDLGVLADGVMEGRRIFASTLKYVLMATSSNFGNMFSAAGASLFLSFLPMLPSQILLNNLLYDVGQLAIPTDRVDAEVLARPAAWDIAFVRRFMAVLGPVSSIFDFMTFFVMLEILHAGPSEFRSGWFVESLATQTLVVFVIRTRRVPFFRSRPSLARMITPPTCALIGAVLPFTLSPTSSASPPCRSASSSSSSGWSVATWSSSSS